MRLDPKNSSKLKKLTKKIITWTWTGNWHGILKEILSTQVVTITQWATGQFSVMFIKANLPKFVTLKFNSLITAVSYTYNNQYHSLNSQNDPLLTSFLNSQAWKTTNQLLFSLRNQISYLFQPEYTKRFCVCVSSTSNSTFKYFILL